MKRLWMTVVISMVAIGLFGWNGPSLCAGQSRQVGMATFAEAIAAGSWGDHSAAGRPDLRHPGIVPGTQTL